MKPLKQKLTGVFLTVVLSSSATFVTYDMMLSSKSLRTFRGGT